MAESAAFGNAYGMPRHAQRFQLPYYAAFGGIAGRKELYCLIYGHLQYLPNVLAFVGHLQNIILESAAMAAFADHLQVRHELHGYGYNALALALLASAALGIE